MDSPGRTIEASVWRVQHSLNSRDLLYISGGGGEGVAPQPLQKSKCLVSTKLAILFQWQLKVVDPAFIELILVLKISEILLTEH